MGTLCMWYPLGDTSHVQFFTLPPFPHIFLHGSAHPYSVGPAGARQRLPSLRPRASILPFFPLFARLPSPRSLIDATIPPPKSELEEERRRRGEFGRTGPRGGSGKSKHDGLKEENQCCPPPPSPLSVSHQSDIQQASSLPTSFVLLLRSHFPPDSPRPLSLQT